MLHRGFKHSVMKFKIKKSKLDALQNLLGVENNQVLIRQYGIIDAVFRRCVRVYMDDEGRTSFVFRKLPHDPHDHDINDCEFIDILC